MWEENMERVKRDKSLREVGGAGVMLPPPVLALRGACREAECIVKTPA